VDWIGPAWDMDKWKTPVNVVMNLRVPYNSGKLSSSYITGRLSRSAQLYRVS
jgi:hypothetical protein